MSRPNILLLHAHDAGRYCEPYGWPVRTPNLLRFAREGVLFRKAYCAAPTCGPSRAAMLTGTYPHQCGMFGLPGWQGWELSHPERHLVRVLNEEGYLTVLAGVQHEVDHADLSPLQYARILDTRPQRGEFYPETLDRVEEFLTTPGDRPFFLSIGIDEPHRNNIARPEIGVGNESARFSKTRYYDPEKLDARYTAPLPWLPDTPEIRRDVASLHEGVRIMDDYMGRVFDMLRQRGLEDNTLVIVTSDHGIEFTGGKKTLTDQGTGVMLMVRGPGGFTGGRVVESLVSHLDVVPTILRAIDASPRPWLEGLQLQMLLAGPDAAWRDAVFTEQNYHGPLEPLRAVRTERYKLVRHHDPVGAIQRHDGPTCPIMESYGAYDRPVGHEELFDLYLDPMEANNRIADPRLAEVAADLRGRLDRWMAMTGDCFPSGNFPKPPRG